MYTITLNNQVPWNFNLPTFKKAICICTTKYNDHQIFWLCSYLQIAITCKQTVGIVVANNNLLELQWLMQDVVKI